MVQVSLVQGLPSSQPVEVPITQGGLGNVVVVEGGRDTVVVLLDDVVVEEVVAAVVLVTLVVEVVAARVEVVVVEASVLVVVVGTTVDDVVEEEVVDVLVVGLLVVFVELLVLEVLVAAVLLVVELLDVLVELLVELLVEDDEVEVDVVLVVATVLLVVELLDVLVVVGTVVVVEHPGMGVCWQPPVGEHVSVVQASPSSQLTALPAHWPAVQVSAVVQAVPSLHAVPSARGACAQPLAGLQVSVVQVLPSSQLMVLPTHWPAAQASAVVQAFASSQGVPFVTAVWVQPVAGSQVSVLQALPSSQLTALPTH